VLNTSIQLVVSSLRSGEFALARTHTRACSQRELCLLLARIIIKETPNGIVADACGMRTLRRIKQMPLSIQLHFIASENINLNPQ
jgi:hypothetical protein